MILVAILLKIEIHSNILLKIFEIILNSWILFPFPVGLRERTPTSAGGGGARCGRQVSIFCSKVGRLVGARETREGDFAAEIDRADQKISPFWIIKAGKT